MSHACVLGICVAILGQQPADIELLQGTWTVRSAVMNGKPTPSPERMIWTFTFGKDNKILVRKTAHPDQLWRFDLDPEATTKRIDLILPMGDEPGIYRLETDRLTLALPADNQKKRPMTFDFGQKAIVLTLEKQKPGSSDEIDPAKLAIVEPNLQPDEKWLVGRWELITEKAAKQGESDRVEIDFRFADKIVEIRRTTTKPVFGLTSKLERKCQLPFVLEPKGKKDAIGIVEEIDSKTNMSRIRIVPCNFRANVLELSGAVHSTVIGNVNLTGQWKRINAKN